MERLWKLNLKILAAQVIVGLLAAGVAWYGFGDPKPYHYGLFWAGLGALYFFFQEDERPDGIVAGFSALAAVWGVFILLTANLSTTEGRYVVAAPFVLAVILSFALAYDAADGPFWKRFVCAFPAFGISAIIGGLLLLHQKQVEAKEVAG